MRLTFTVTDSGMGITAADLKRLFRPFAQASEEVARRYGGAGLGLVLVKRIAKAMGGDLVVTSKPGRGSTFRLTVVMKSAASAARRRVTGGKPLAGLRVLSVEDNPYGRIVHSAVLRELGHTVSFVGSGEAAVETVARNEHDVVLMDVALPGIDGIEATRRIRALPRARRPHSDHRRIGPHRAARRRGREGGRHERLSAQARVARGIERGAAGGGRAQARLISPMMTSSTTAPIVALMIEATMPPPITMPMRGSSQPAMNAPTMPTTMLPIRPKPMPRTIRPASQPATAPTTE